MCLEFGQQVLSRHFKISLSLSHLIKHVRIVRIGKKTYNYGIGTLRIDFGLERIIPSYAFSPLSEKNKFPKIEIAY